jgi:2-alkenal reductase
MSKKTLLFISLLLLPLLAFAAGNTLPALGVASAAPTAGTVFDALEATLEQIYDGVNPSVVNIRVVGQATTLPADHPAIPEPQEFLPQGGQGSGFVWDQEGHIVTNNHVVEGAQEIWVTFYDNTTVPAELVGADPHSELAVIKVDLPAQDLQPVEVADSTQVRVGQLAVAIGNPLDSPTQTDVRLSVRAI